MINDDERGPYPHIELPRLALAFEGAPPDGYVTISQFNGILAAARTSWQARRVLDTNAPSLDWYYIRTAHETRVWSAEHLPSMRVDGFERFSGVR